MLRGLLIQIWTCCKKNGSMIFGMSIRTEVCQIRGKDSQNSLCWKRSFQKDLCGLGERLTKIQTTTRPDVYGQKYGRRLAKPHQSSIMPGNSEDLIWSIRMKTNAVNFSKMRGENWKDLWHQPCRAKDLQMASRKRLRRCRTHPTRFRKRFIGCMVVSHESTRQRVESSQLQKNHEDHIAGKGFASMSHYNSAHKVLPMPQAMEWKKLETSPACDLGSVKSKKRGYSGSTKRQKESPLCNIDGHMSPQECRVGTKITEVQKRQSRAPWWQCKRRLWSLCSFYWTGLVCVPDDWRDNNGCYCEITDFVSDKQVMQLSACSHVKLEDAPRLLKNS